MFKRLSTELALIYAALFGAVLMLIAGAVWLAVESNSRDAVKAEMSASSAVFDRLWKLRADQLSQTADVLARDFGFLRAVAEADEDTLLSALDNLQSRSGLDTAFIVNLDGRIVAMDDAAAGADPALLDALNVNSEASGVLMLGGVPYQAVAAPINAPTLIGWVVFGQRLGGADLGELESLSAIPLTAHLYIREGDAPWISVDSRGAKSLKLASEDLGIRAFGASNALIDIPENQSVAGVKALERRKLVCVRPSHRADLRPPRRRLAPRPWRTGGSAGEGPQRDRRAGDKLQPDVWRDRGA
jgi:hypothetical protein